MIERDPLNLYLRDFEDTMRAALDGLPIRVDSVRAEYSQDVKGNPRWEVYLYLTWGHRYPDNEGVDHPHQVVSACNRSLAVACEAIQERVWTIARRTDLLIQEDVTWALRSVGKRVRHIHPDGDWVPVWEFSDEGREHLRIPVPVGHTGVIVEHRPGRVRVVFDQPIPGATDELWVHRWKFENHRRAPNGNELMDADPFYKVLS